PSPPINLCTLSGSPALSISQKRRRRPRFRPTSGHKLAILGARLPCNRLDCLTFSESQGVASVPQTIALVDDDRNILTSLQIALEAEGFAVRTYTDGAEALRGLTANPVDLAILDIKMPRMDGMELLERLRRQSELPVIFLTSKDDEVDELMGLRMGADDYIKKPFSQRLLIERIRTLLRREALSREGPTGAAETVVRGDLLLDAARHLCTWKGQPVDLTVTEFLLLKSLA